MVGLVVGFVAHGGWKRAASDCPHLDSVDLKFGFGDSAGEFVETDLSARRPGPDSYGPSADWVDYLGHFRVRYLFWVGFRFLFWVGWSVLYCCNFLFRSAGLVFCPAARSYSHRK